MQKKYKSLHPHIGLVEKAGEKTVGRPDKILLDFFPDTETGKEFVEALINEGEIGKQIRNSLILRKAADLVNAVSNITGEKPEFEDGFHLLNYDSAIEESTHTLRLSESILDTTKDPDTILEEAGNGKAEDVQKDTFLIRVLQWTTELILKLPLVNKKKIDTPNLENLKDKKTRM